MPFCPGAGAGIPRDTPGHTTPGHPGTRSRGPPGTPRDTHPGHPGTTCIYEGRGGRGLDTAPGPARRQKYKTYRYIVLCWGGEKDVALVSVLTGILCPGPRLRCSVPASDGLSTIALVTRLNFLGGRFILDRPIYIPTEVVIFEAPWFCSGSVVQKCVVGLVFTSQTVLTKGKTRVTRSLLQSSRCDVSWQIPVW